LSLWLIIPPGMAWTSVRIRWVGRLDPGHYVAGAEYAESSKGRFGPEVDAVPGVGRDCVALVGALHEDRPGLQ